MILDLNKNIQPVNIAIIGGGFCGIITAIHLLKNTEAAIHIHIINKDNPLAKGVAYNPHTASLLLNVPNGKISAFDSLPNHFTDWLINDQPQLKGIVELPGLFATRQQYGRYLAHIWHEALNNKPENAAVTIYEDEAFDMVKDGHRFHVFLQQNPVLTADFVVLATGNAAPGLPKGLPMAFANSKRYFGNPWKRDSIENLSPNGDVLIIGNGLTMVDTVMGLVEKGFDKKIHTISPNGYSLNPSKMEKAPYEGADLKDFMTEEVTLLSIVKNLNRHRKIAQQLNQSFFQVMDALRPYNQQIWQALSMQEKQRFLKHLRHLWGSIRHRLPVKLYAYIDKLYAAEKLFTYKGHIIAVTETNNKAIVTLNCSGEIKTIGVQRVINCTGPEGNLKLSSNKLLHNLANKGLICADDLNMGINAAPENGMVLTAEGDRIPNLFVIGTNLKGVLWESTAIPELRVQAKKLAAHLTEKCQGKLLIKQTA